MKKLLATFALAATLAIGGTALSATPASLTTPKAEAATYSQCFTAMNGERWCYRTGCTFWEWAGGCRDGWVRTNTWYARGAHQILGIYA
jgi:hypothetical protein